MHVELAFGALHLDIAIGREPGTDPTIDRGRASFFVFAVSTFESTLEIRANCATTHSFPFRHFGQSLVNLWLFLALGDLMLGAKPVLYVFAGFAAAALIHLKCGFSNGVLGDADAEC